MGQTDWHSPHFEHLFISDLKSSNFCINTWYHEIFTQIYLSLLEFDQLKDAKQFHKCIATNFKEGKIEFNPTFKFNDGTCDYNMNSDDHVPSWTDRILYRKQPGTNTVFDVVLNEYNSQPDVLISDHKPVYAYFTFTIEHEL